MGKNTTSWQRKSKCVAKLEKIPLFGVKSHIKRKRPGTDFVSIPGSFMVGSAGLNLCLCDGHLQTSVLRIYPVGVPGALLAGGAAASLTDPGHSFALRASLCSVALSHGACGRSSLGSLHLPLAAILLCFTTCVTDIFKFWFCVSTLLRCPIFSAAVKAA